MTRTVIALALLCLVAPHARGAASVKKRKHQPAAKPKVRVATATHSTSTTRRTAARRRGQPMPVFDPTAGDNVDGDDLAVRRAAVDALGKYNGTVAVVDPQS